MTPRPQPRLPYAPISALVSASTVVGAARALGVDRRTLYRYRFDGVPVGAADRLATALGLHPAAVWGEAWSVAFDQYTQTQQPRRRTMNERTRLYAQEQVGLALTSLNNLTTADFGVGGDRPARLALVRALVALGIDTTTLDPDYRDAANEAVEDLHGFERGTVIS